MSFYLAVIVTAEIIGLPTEDYKGLSSRIDATLSDHVDAYQGLCAAGGWEADLARQVVMGYVSYALNRVGEVAESAADVDTIMSFGFNWAPPTVIVDLLGAKPAIELLQRYKLKVPPIVQQAAAGGVRLYAGSVLDYGRTFVG
jgi:hypothetical protein